MYIYLCTVYNSFCKQAYNILCVLFILQDIDTYDLIHILFIIHCIVTATILVSLIYYLFLLII